MRFFGPGIAIDGDPWDSLGPFGLLSGRLSSLFDVRLFILKIQHEISIDIKGVSR